VIELPVLIAIGAIAVARVVIPLVSEVYSDAVARKRPEFLDESIIQFLYPLTREKAMISSRPATNSERFLHRESIARTPELLSLGREYSRHLRRGALFGSHWIALSRVNGGKGGRVVIVAVGMIPSPCP